MRKTHGILLSMILLLLAPKPPHLWSGPTDHDDLRSKVDQVFSEWDKPDSPGCALAVIQNGKIVYKRGYGMADLEHNIPIAANSVFYIGSTSKQFVTMSILLLREQGKLSLDDDIRKFIPEFPRYDQPITIRHLIHHTSGIRDYLTLWRLSGRDYLDYIPQDAVLQLICRQQELNFTPGTQYLYSNSCYLLLAVIVKTASGQSLREYAQEHIFEPLGMHNSHFHDNNQHIVKNRAFGYTKSNDGGFGNLIMRFDLVGSGGLYTTVEDLYHWDQNFYNNKLGKGGPELIDSMLVNGKFSNGEEVDYAFALRHGTYRGAKTVSHGGSLAGYRAQLMRFPEHKFSVAILSNLAGFDPTSRAFEVADVYLGQHLGAKVPGVNQRSESQTEPGEKILLSSEQLAELIGDYYSDELDVIYRISDEAGQLFLSIPSHPPMPVEPKGNDAFSGQVNLFFTRDENEQINGFTVDAGRVTNLKFLRR